MEIKSKEHGWLDIEEAQNSGIMRTAHAEVFKKEIRKLQVQQLRVQENVQKDKFPEEVTLLAATTQEPTQVDDVADRTLTEAEILKGIQS